MLTTPRDRATVERLQELLVVIFDARDRLYEASESLADTDLSYICHMLGDQLGGEAADLQQIISASGVEPIDTYWRIGKEAKNKTGDGDILESAERIERLVMERYKRAIRCLTDNEVAGLLNRQRQNAQFAECVLRHLEHAAHLTEQVHECSAQKACSTATVCQENEK
jgi:hypothetical protein